MNRKKIDLQKKIQKKSKGEVSKPSALRAEHNIWALSIINSLMIFVLFFILSFQKL